MDSVAKNFFVDDTLKAPKKELIIISVLVQDNSGHTRLVAFGECTQLNIVRRFKQLSSPFRMFLIAFSAFSKLRTNSSTLESNPVVLPACPCH
ncbi:hypothetical protein A0H81_09480 [Grifola frondosa]|uniref:Uncharacterized protein n=1 Tax=Grifola frondosa TaxID=5627 RepID=A0A1C7M3E9_GRIFR|nr:hypothetical protein A0H81_09480 [Grifola frondosa]